ncbi:MAG: sugar transferase [Elusimicrobia bacterium]|nr:sugar transferase [Elusimicrobiota bacterium]
MRSKIRRIIFPIVLFLADIFAVYFSFIFAYWLRFYSNWVPVARGIPPFELYHTAIIVVIFLWEIIFIYSGFYSERKIDVINEYLRILKGVFIGTVIIAAITFLYREFTFSRLMLAIAFAISTIIIFVFHEIIRIMDIYLGNLLLGTHKILVLGSGRVAEDIQKILKKKRNFEVHHSHFSDLEHLRNFINAYAINEVIFSKSQTAHKEIIKVANICEDFGIDFRFVPDILELSRGEIVIDEFLGIPVFRLKATSLYGWSFFAKRLLDISFSLFVLMFTIVPLLIIALIIKLEDGGPVFYEHKRKGYRGGDFNFLKFRTMVVNADQILDEIKHLSERSGPVFKMKNDPRITKIGKFLRKFSLDEMPQFINVLKGDMSIVGPRPQVLWEAAHYDEFAKRRLKVLPGITGLWQVRGRSDLSYEEMISLDIYYLENWSVALDIRIILSTVPAIMSQKGAY